MNEKRKRGRPPGGPRRVKLHVSVDGELFEKAHNPKCSIASTIERGLRASIIGCKSEDINCIAFLIREEKRQIAFHTQNLTRLRDRARQLGVENLDEFEDGLNGW